MWPNLNGRLALACSLLPARVCGAVERSYPALTIVWPNLNGRVTHLNATAFTLTATLASFAADRLTYTVRCSLGLGLRVGGKPPSASPHCRTYTVRCFCARKPPSAGLT